MGDVILLPGIQAIMGEPNHNAADMLQKVVNKLRTGEIEGVAYSALNPDGSCCCNWLCPPGTGNDLFVGVALLHNEMLRSMD